MFIPSSLCPCECLSAVIQVEMCVNNLFLTSYCHDNCKVRQKFAKKNVVYFKLPFSEAET